MKDAEKKSKEIEKKLNIKMKLKSVNLYKILTCVMAVAFVVSLGVLLRNKFVAKQADEQFKELANQVNQAGQSTEDRQSDEPLPTEEIQPTESDSNPDNMEMTETETENTGESGGIQKIFDWETLRMYNKDIYAWIYIPGTVVDYPILQHPKDDSHYLNYNLNGKRGYPGCIYTELANSKDFSDFDTVVYGHNMLDGSMFASLHYYEDQSFFDSNPYVYVYIEDKILIYEIFAAYSGSNLHILNGNDFTTDSGRVAYLDSIMQNEEKNCRKRDLEVTAESHILTLSTCIKGKSENRYLVQAKLINEEVLYELNNEQSND